MLRKAGFVEVIGHKNFCATFDDALVRANQGVQREAGNSWSHNQLRPSGAWFLDEFVVDTKLPEKLQAGCRGVAWRCCAAPLMRSCYHYDTSEISKSRIRVDCNCRIIVAPARRARSYPKAGVSFALLRSASALKTTASVGSIRPRTKVPLVRRKKPGPAERLASAEGLNSNEAFSRNVC